MRFRVVLACLALFPVRTLAATFELQPMVGWEAHAPRDLAGPRNDQLDLKNVALRGISAGYLVDEGQVELSWTRANSAAEIQQAEGAPPDRFDVRIEQFRFNGLYLFYPESSVQPFVLLGVGATLYTPANSRSNTTRFSGAVGGGLKWLWNDYIGLRFDALWTPTFAPTGTHFFCDANGEDCYSLESNSYFSQYPFLHNMQFTSGLLLRI